MIDTHCHLTFKPLLDQIDAVLDRAQRAGVDRMITVGTSPSDTPQVLGLAQRFDHVYATVGVHPHNAHVCRDEAEVIATLRHMATNPKVVAVGEMGLDKHYPEPPIQDQRRVFAWQLRAVKDHDKPIIIHNRQATDEVLAMIGDSDIPGKRFVFHCFTGDAAELEAILSTGAMVSFTGIVTFKNAASLAACTARVPLDQLMIETDSPYLTPEPHRKIRPNEPSFVPLVAKFIARQRGDDETAFVQAVDQNAKRFFRLPD